MLCTNNGCNNNLHYDDNKFLRNYEVIFSYKFSQINQADPICSVFKHVIKSLVFISSSKHEDHRPEKASVKCAVVIALDW